MKKQPLPVFQRLAAGLLGVGIILAFVSGVTRFVERRANQPEITEQQPKANPVREQLKRCSKLTNEKAMADEKCQRAWIINRQRFFGRAQDNASQEEE